MVRCHTHGFVARSTVFYHFGQHPGSWLSSLLDPDAVKGLFSSSSFDLQKPLLQIGYKLFQADKFLLAMPLATSIYNHGKPVKIVSIIAHYCILFLG